MLVILKASVEISSKTNHQIPLRLNMLIYCNVYMILRLKFNYDGVDWKLVKDLFLQDLLCCWIYQLSILNISIIPVDSICGVLKVVTMSI